MTPLILATLTGIITGMILTRLHDRSQWARRLVFHLFTMDTR